MFGRTLAFLAGFVAICSPARAQEAEPRQLPPGARVRVQLAATDSAEAIVEAGTLVATDEGSLTLMSAGEADPLVLQRNQIERVELRTAGSKKGFGAWVGGAVGFLTGFTLGVVAAKDAKEVSDSSVLFLDAEENDEAAIGLLSGAIFGAAGALIGLAAAPGEQWETLEDDAVFVGVTLLPARQGFGLALGGQF